MAGFDGLTAPGDDGALGSIPPGVQQSAVRAVKVPPAMLTCPQDSPTATAAHALRRHPASLCVAVRAIEACARLAENGNLALSYRLHGDPESIRIPEPALPSASDGLWQHTCLEAFVVRSTARNTVNSTSHRPASGQTIASPPAASVISASFPLSRHRSLFIIAPTDFALTP